MVENSQLARSDGRVANAFKQSADDDFLNDYKSLPSPCYPVELKLLFSLRHISMFDSTYYIYYTSAKAYSS